MLKVKPKIISSIFLVDLILSVSVNNLWNMKKIISFGIKSRSKGSSLLIVHLGMDKAQIT